MLHDSSNKRDERTHCLATLNKQKIHSYVSKRNLEHISIGEYYLGEEVDMNEKEMVGYFLTELMHDLVSINNIIDVEDIFKIRKIDLSKYKQANLCEWKIEYMGITRKKHKDKNKIWNNNDDFKYINLHDFQLVNSLNKSSDKFFSYQHRSIDFNCTWEEAIIRLNEKKIKSLTPIVLINELICIMGMKEYYLLPEINNDI